MARYIDVEPVISEAEKELKILEQKMLRGVSGAGASAGTLAGITARLVDAPTADVVEVRHGEWILHPDGSATCNQCKTHQLLIWDMDRSQNFCGHCGAKMDGGKAE